MQRLEDSVAVVASVGSPMLSIVRYSVRPENFFTVDADADDGMQEYEISRIVAASLGLVCAHEGI